MTLNKMSFKKKVKISIGGIFVLIIGSVATVVCKQILLQFNTLGVQAKLPKIEETLKAEKLKQTSLDLQSSLEAKAEKDAKIVPIMVNG